MGNKLNNICQCGINYDIKEELKSYINKERIRKSDADRLLRLQLRIKVFIARLKIKKMIMIKSKEFDAFIEKKGVYIENPYNFNKIGMKNFKRKNFVTFEKKAIKLLDGNIYEGEWSEDFKKKGYGCLYLKNGVMIEGMWNDNELIGEAVMLFPFKIQYTGYLKGLYPYNKGLIIINDSHNKIQWKDKECFNNNIKSIYEDNDNSIIIYDDYSLYIGGLNKNLEKHGKGKYHNINGRIHDGNWKDDKIHGEGVSYYPDNSNFTEKLIKSVENRLNCIYFGPGLYIKSNWIKDQINGNGIILSEKEILHCVWRYGKMVNSKSINKRRFHQNIFTYLTQNENYSLYKLKNKNICDLIKNTIYLTTENKHIILPKKSISINGKSTFLPLIGYFTNGGFFEKRFHYSNAFNPNHKLGYISHFTLGRNKNLILSALLNTHMLDEINNNKTDNCNLIYTEDTFEMKNMSKMYIQKFNYDDYEFDYHNYEIIDEKILKKYENNSKFFINYIFINIPYRLSAYTYILNPVRTLAIYIHDEPNPEFNDNIDSKFISNEISVNSFGKDIIKLFKKLENIDTILKKEINKNNAFVEFETNNKFGNKLLALIFIQEYQELFFSLKPNHHKGKYLSIKLIDQNTFSGYKNSSIDIGTINFFGQILN